jgi:hypothetical protein
MRRLLLLTLVGLLGGCSEPAPFSTTVGALPAGSTIRVRVERGQVDAYKPLMGGPTDRFTISATAPNNVPTATPPALRRSGKVLTVTASDPLRYLLLRVPNGVTLDASSSNGDVNVTDITGVAIAHADHGNVRVMVPGYAQASATHGNVTVFMGATKWPGTLRFSSERGDVEVWVNATARFHVHMHVLIGKVFTDFGLTGTSQGESEEITGDVGGPSLRGIDITVGEGNIRLLQLKPQV